MFFETIKNSAQKDIPFAIAYYGPSTVSFEYVFPSWGEIIKYVLKEEVEKAIRNDVKAYWNIHTMNFGLTGATSKDLLERLDGLVLARKPDLIILFLGKNDAYLGISERQSQENAQKIIEMALERNIKVVFASSAPALRLDLNQKIAPYVEVDRKVAGHFKNDSNFIFVDIFSLFPQEAVEKSYTFISGGNKVVGVIKGEIDPLHYNRYGNAIIAKIILQEAFGINFNEKKFLREARSDKIKYPNY